MIDSHVHVQSDRLLPLLRLAMGLTGIAKIALIGSPRCTFTLDYEDGFRMFHENNDFILDAALNDSAFDAWPTIDPLDYKNNIATLESFIKRDASGLKLYIGHACCYGFPPRFVFHSLPINSFRLFTVYDFCSRNKFPILLHVNTTPSAYGFAQEFEDVLEQFPDLCVIAPHWMLSSRRPNYLTSTLSKYPNLYIDISFGQDQFIRDGFKRISENVDTFRQICNTYSDRILYGSDLVCTEADYKNVSWICNRMRSYQELLTCAEFVCPISRDSLEGLGLTDVALERIFAKNYERLRFTKRNLIDGVRDSETESSHNREAC